VSFCTQGHGHDATNHYKFYENWRREHHTFLMEVYRKTVIHFENKERLGKFWVLVTEYTICNPVHLFPLDHPSIPTSFISPLLSLLAKTVHPLHPPTFPNFKNASSCRQPYCKCANCFPITLQMALIKQTAVTFMLRIQPITQSSLSLRRPSAHSHCLVLQHILSTLCTSSHIRRCLRRLKLLEYVTLN
jgi:hypothetical protein